MFHWDNGLKLTKADLAIDFRRRQPRAFISHAHSDHIARHEYALCTPETAALYQHRLGPRPTLPMPYRTPIDWGGLRLTTFPAGHCLGSAMLLAEDGEQSLLYTGDFKLGESATAAQGRTAARRHPGDREHLRASRLPPAAARSRCSTNSSRSCAKRWPTDAVPVIQAYVLGKGQEVTRLLTDAGIPVLQHRDIFAVSQVYEACGVSLGQYERFTGKARPGWAVVVPPGGEPVPGKGDRSNLPNARRAFRQIGPVPFSPPGPHRRDRLGGRPAGEVSASASIMPLPLSDHADYDELFEAVARVEPRVVYCTHGPESFVDRLRDAGYDAHPLGQPTQGRLF